MDLIAPIAAAILVMAAVTVAAFLRRLRLITTAAGSFECPLRLVGTQRWRQGFARMDVERLSWFPEASLSREPAHTWGRASVDVVWANHGTACAGGATTRAIVRIDGTEYETLLRPDAYTGLLSWSESEPSKLLLKTV